MIDQPLRSEPGVYAIRFMLDKRTYIGSSVNLKKRIQNHLSDLRKNKHHSRHLQRAWNKYGEPYFEVFALGYYDKDAIRTEEQFWLDNASCSFNGSRIATRPEHTDEVRKKISEGVKAAWQRDDVREKMRNRALPIRQKGYKATPEAIMKLREVHRAKHRTVQAFGKLWSIKELAEEYGVKYTMLKDRLRSGWDAEKAVTQVKRKGGL